MLKNLTRDAQELDSLMAACLQPGDLKSRLSPLLCLISSLERTCSRLLKYLDGTLHRTIKELDGDIELMRRRLTALDMLRIEDIQREDIQKENIQKEDML